MSILAAGASGAQSLRPAKKWAYGLVLLSALGAPGAAAADLGYGPRSYAPPPPPAPPPYAFATDPRCSVVPMPQLDLVGDTARFRATAVCQSRGLYADSVIFPEPPVLYRGYNYGRER
ncbi:conserved hypothetical protein [Methylocella tundrae]|uniref:Uncharacterized protein n=1 Tax=Methylocella tundrae TaxID=227605 RepID=A0A8B6MCG0_METTU|nr:hypothetical protein [Methylocella tundrae]VTZ26749.1 conserved hypothetical protein [Methylocella tundrae]VTZ52255.1 conserved hypothetical protein [Methylocella tundrae]